MTPIRSSYATRLIRATAWACAAALVACASPTSRFYTLSGTNAGAGGDSSQRGRLAD